jgi:DNA repair exonuclease SbcCD ATPase subunit
MAGILGFVLGAASKQAGDYANAKFQQKQEQQQLWHSFMMDAYQKNPAIANTPQGQKAGKEMFGEHWDEVNTGLNLIDQGNRSFTKELQAASGGGAGMSGPAPAAGSPGLMMPPQGQMPQGQIAQASTGPQQPSAPSGAQPQGDETQQHLDFLNQRLSDVTALEGQYGSSAAHMAQIKSTKDDLNRQIQELEQQRSQEQIEKRQDKREAQTAANLQSSEAATAERQDKTIAAMAERQDKTFAAETTRMQSMQDHSERMEAMRERHSDELEQIRTAASAAKRTDAFQKIIAAEGKEGTDLASKLNKGSDYDQKNREAEVEARNQNLDVLSSLTDDPKQVEALQKMKMNVGAATPGYFSTTPGAVGGGSADGSKTTTSKSGKPVAMGPDGKYHYIE